MKEITELIYKFNSDSKTEFYEVTESKPYKLLTMLCTGKADDISDVDKLWLIKQMERQSYFPHDSVCVLGWRLYFKPYLTRFIYRLTIENTFTIIYGIDRKSVEAYLKEFIDEHYEIAELIELPENY
jgi:hypothetical protein|nr:MAG TPA: hypothetical protein [Caudoviricetes sp.]